MRTLLLTAISILTINISAQEFYVVINNENTLKSISKSQLKQIFLGQKTFWDNQVRIQPAILRSENNSLEKFYTDILVRSKRKYDSHWRKLLFSGAAIPPKKFTKEKTLIDFIANNPSSIGVLQSTKKVNKVKIITIK